MWQEQPGREQKGHLPDMHQVEGLQGSSPAEGTSLAEEGTSPAEGGTPLAEEALHPHSSEVAQGTVELIPVVGILFPSSEILIVTFHQN